MPISKSALVTATVHQFQKLGLVLCMVFNQEFEFCVQTFFTSLLKNSIFIHSEARLSSLMQNWKKLPCFHDCLTKGVPNFECLLLNLHTLNHNTQKGWSLVQYYEPNLKYIAQWEPSLRQGGSHPKSQPTDESDAVDPKAIILQQQPFL